MKPSQALAKARQLIQEKGWIKGDLHDTDGYCLLGAIFTADGRLNKALDNDEGYDHFGGKALEALRKAICPDPDPPGVSCSPARTIFYWNDNLCMDADDAIHKLKLAEEIAREAESEDH